MTEDKNTNLIVAQVNDNAEVITSLAIVDTATLTEGAQLRTNVRKLMDAIETEKTKVTRPLLDALEAERARWRPAEKRLKDALALLDKKITDYNAKVEAERAKKEAQIAARVERGTMKMETAVAKMGTLAEAPKEVEVMGGSITYRTDRYAEVIDASLLHREYLIPDMKKIEEALKGGATVPGAVMKEKKIIVNKR